MKEDLENKSEKMVGSLISPITPTSLLSTLDQFLYLASNASDRHLFPYSRERSSSQDENDQVAVESALFLLQNLPPARSAALTYLAQALSKQVILSFLYFFIYQGKQNLKE